MTRRKWLAFNAAGVLMLGNIGLRAQEASVLHEGTPVRMRMNRTISSATEKQGDNVDFETLDDVKLGDLIVIPKGSIAMATVTEAATKKSMGRAGKLSVNIDFVRLPSGEKLALRGVQDVKGGGHVGAMTGAIVATSIVFFPAAPLFLFIHGKDITIPKGHEVTVYTNTDYAPKAVQTVSVNNASPALTGKALTNDDVLALKRAGLSDELIIEKIKSSPGQYSLETTDLVSLKQAGIADGVISAMIQAPKHN
jgi:hypothetical protein